MDSSSSIPMPASELFRAYSFDDAIGEGQSGRVWRCHDRTTGESLACKQIRKKGMSDVELSDLQREVDAMMRLRGHRNVLSLRGLYEDDKAVYMLTELCEGGDLFAYISAHDGLNEPAAARIFAQLASAVHWCHMHRVVHRDIKPENVLLVPQKSRGSKAARESPQTPLSPKSAGTASSDSPSHPSNSSIGSPSHRADEGGEVVGVRLADFGLAFPLSPGAAIIGAAGSVPYEAPEVLALAPYNYCADIWSLGVLLYAMLSANWPAFPNNARKLLPSDFGGDPWPSISFQAKDLVRRMLTVNPIERLDIFGVLDHPWLAMHAAPPSPLSPSPSPSLYAAPPPSISAQRRSQRLQNQSPLSTLRPVVAKDRQEEPAPASATLAPSLPKHHLRLLPIRDRLLALSSSSSFGDAPCAASNLSPITGPSRLQDAPPVVGFIAPHKLLSRLKLAGAEDGAAFPPSPSGPAPFPRLQQSASIGALVASEADEDAHGDEDDLSARQPSATFARENKSVVAGAQVDDDAGHEPGSDAQNSDEGSAADTSGDAEVAMARFVPVPAAKAPAVLIQPRKLSGSRLRDGGVSSIRSGGSVEADVDGRAVRSGRQLLSCGSAESHQISAIRSGLSAPAEVQGGGAAGDGGVGGRAEAEVVAPEICQNGRQGGNDVRRIESSCGCCEQEGSEGREGALKDREQQQEGEEQQEQHQQQQLQEDQQQQEYFSASTDSQSEADSDGQDDSGEEIGSRTDDQQCARQSARRASTGSSGSPSSPSRGGRSLRKTLSPRLAERALRLRDAFSLRRLACCGGGGGGALPPFASLTPSVSVSSSTCDP